MNPCRAIHQPCESARYLWMKSAERAAAEVWLSIAFSCIIQRNSALTESAMTSVIVRNPDILGGRAVFRGTRVPVEILFENLEDGLSIDEIIVSYPSLCRADVIACLAEANDKLKAAAKVVAL